MRSQRHLVTDKLNYLKYEPAGTPEMVLDVLIS